MRTIPSLLFVALAGCGSGSGPATVYDVASEYAEHVCDYFESCGVEGSRNECLADVLAGTCVDADCSNWEEEWNGSPSLRDRCFDDLATASCDDIATPPAACNSIVVRADEPDTCGIGTWTVTVTWGVGTCLEPGTSSNAALIVSDASGVYMAQVVDDPNATFSGTVEVDGASCILAGTIETFGTLADGTTTFTEMDSLSLTETDGQISGSASVSVTFGDGSTCSQQASYVGRFE